MRDDPGVCYFRSERIYGQDLLVRETTRDKPSRELRKQHGGRGEGGESLASSYIAGLLGEVLEHAAALDHKVGDAVQMRVYV